MGTSKLVLLAAAAAVLFTIPAAQAQDDAALAAEASARAHGPPKPWKSVRGLGRVLDLTKLPIVIDEPGLYAIDRNWELLPKAANLVPGMIEITADNVTLDLHGFTISADPGVGTLLVTTGLAGDIEIRNGGIAACCSDGGVAIGITSPRGARLHHLSVFSYDRMTFEGGTSFTDSDIRVRVGMQFTANGASLQRNSIDCNRGRCAAFIGDDNRVTDNKMIPYQGGVIRFEGDGNIVVNNVIDASNAIDVLEWVFVKGDSNVLRANTVLLGGFVGEPIFSINGTANTLDGNIAASPFLGFRAPVGMEFTADGNFYGNNRMAAQIPFALGSTTQTNWGGNVGY